MMSRVTGKDIDDIAHLAQSIIDILTTPLGSRVMLREYGSTLFELIDRPVNRSWAMNMYSAVAIALYKWEPRIRLRKITLDGSRVSQGILGISLEGDYLPSGKPIQLDNLSLQVRTGAASDATIASYRPL